VPPDVFVYSIEKGQVSHLGLDLDPSPPAVFLRRSAEAKGLTFSYGRSDEPGRQARLSIPRELRQVLFHIYEIDEHKRLASMAYRELEQCIYSLKELTSSVRSRKQVSQHGSESPKVKEKEEIHAVITPIYSLKPPHAFSDIRLRLLEDDKCIRVYTPGQTEGRDVSYAQFGMAHERTGKPIDLWDLLVSCIENGGMLPQLPEGSEKEKNQLKSVKRRMKEKLSAAFGTDEDPFSLLTDGTGYQLKCRIEEKQRSDRLICETDLGTDIETVDGKQKVAFWQPKRTRHHDNHE
jgi:hypothetical protein